MVCPKCHSSEFVKSQDFPYPLVNMGKEVYDKVNIRRYWCVMCDYKFMTEEKFVREVTPRTKKEEKSGLRTA